MLLLFVLSVVSFTCVDVVIGGWGSVYIEPGPRVIHFIHTLYAV